MYSPRETTAGSALAAMAGYGASNRRFHRSSTAAAAMPARSSTSRNKRASTRETCKLIRQTLSRPIQPTMAPFDVLREYLEARAAFTDADLAFIRERFIATT